MLGMSKIFVIFIFISAIIGYGTKSWTNFFIVLGSFALVRLIWKLLT